MLAAQIERFGGPEVLQSVTMVNPIPESGQVLIDVEFANITFIETQLRSGRPPHEAMRPPLPIVLGNGVGGTVLATGDDADAVWVGRRVVSSLTGQGGYAERAVTDAERLVAVPDGFDTAQAVAVLADGRTALLLVDALADALEGLDGRTIVVTAAAGGVGGLLVQLLRTAGSRVIGAAGGQRKLDHVRSLGADLAVDYRRPAWADAAIEPFGPADALLDGVGGQLAQSGHTAVRDDGIVLAFGMAGGSPPPTTERLRHVSIGAPTVPESVALSRRAIDLVAAGELAVTIGARFPLSQAAQAHAAIESRAVIGKTLLTAS